jgi:hypothetical protein
VTPVDAPPVGAAERRCIDARHPALTRLVSGRNIPAGLPAARHAKQAPDQVGPRRRTALAVGTAGLDGGTGQPGIFGPAVLVGGASLHELVLGDGVHWRSPR